MAVSSSGSSSQFKSSWLVIPVAAAVGSVAALVLAPWFRRRPTSSPARGRSEPVSRHSPYDIEYPPAP
jgi:hypothetical protein